MADISLTYRKTAAGAQELTERALGLTREHRNLLIVTDGRNALSKHGKAVGCDDERLTMLADDLLQKGLIEPSGLARMVGGNAQGTDASAPPMVALADLRGQVIDLTVRMFGDQSKGMVQKIEGSGSSPTELVAAIAAAGKLAKLTIDEKKAQIFIQDANKILGI